MWRNIFTTLVCDNSEKKVSHIRFSVVVSQYFFLQKESDSLFENFFDSIKILKILIVIIIFTPYKTMQWILWDRYYFFCIIAEIFKSIF